MLVCSNCHCDYGLYFVPAKLATGGLAFPDDDMVRKVAHQCLKVFDFNPDAAGCLHVQSRRFLDGTWTGLHGDIDKDPPLRGLMEELASGDKIMSDLLSLETAAATSLIRWVSAFRHVTLHFISYIFILVVVVPIGPTKKTRGGTLTTTI